MAAPPVPATLVRVSVPGLPAVCDANFTDTPAPLVLPLPMMIVLDFRTFVPVPRMRVDGALPLFVAVTPRFRFVAVTVFAVFDSRRLPAPVVCEPTPRFRLVTLIV